MHDSAIAFGSNIGDSRTILESALKTLHKVPGIKARSRSSWYKTKAVGPPQPDYINGCISVCVDMQPLKLLEILLEIENQFGRERTERWGARTLDLDLLLYDDLILHTPTLQIPPSANDTAGFRASTLSGNCSKLGRASYRTCN